MTLRTLMQAGPAKANELFTRLAETSDGALKTRERLFAELKAELEQHAGLEEQHLFPILRKHAGTKELVTAVIRDNKDLRAKLGELDGLPKNDETFLGKLAELQTAFRQHARNEKRELLPAVQKALSGDQVQGIVEKMEGSLTEADQVKHDQAEAKRAATRGEREAREAAEAAVHATEAGVEAVAEGTRQVVRTVAEGAQRAAAHVVDATGETARSSVAVASAASSTGFFLWDMMLGMWGVQPSVQTTRETVRQDAVKIEHATAPRPARARA